MTDQLKRLIRRYNELAKFAKQPTLESWDHDVESLRQKVVALRCKTRKGSLADAAAELMCRVAYVERSDLPRGESNRFEPGSLSADIDFRTVGLPLDEIERLLRRRFPESLVSNNTLRWYATKIRRGGGSERLAGLVLPNTRPRIRP